MRRRAFTLVEILVVVAIVALIAAILFPVLAGSRERSRQAACAARLRQFAAAMNLYRGDNDGLGYRYAVVPARDVLRAPYYQFGPLREYLKDPRVLACPDPQGPMGGLVRYRVWELQELPRGGGAHGSVVTRPGAVLYRAFRPLPGTAVAFCYGHVSDQRDGRDVFEGSYPFVREDGSADVAKAEALRIGYYSAAGWFEAEPAAGSETWRRIVRFPGEPWPLDVEP